MSHKPNLEACARGGKKTAQTFPKNMRQEWGRKGGLKHKPNLEGCAKGGRKGGKAKWEKEMTKARAEEAIKKNPLPISGQVKVIIQAPVLWRGVF